MLPHDQLHSQNLLLSAHWPYSQTPLLFFTLTPFRESPAVYRHTLALVPKSFAYYSLAQLAQSYTNWRHSQETLLNAVCPNHILIAHGLYSQNPPPHYIVVPLPESSALYTLAPTPGSCALYTLVLISKSSASCKLTPFLESYAMCSIHNGFKPRILCSSQLHNAMCNNRWQQHQNLPNINNLKSGCYKLLHFALSF